MGKTVEKKRKKKGRPSLLDLQKRSLRLQNQQQQQEQQQQEENKPKRNPNPNSTTGPDNPYLRFPTPTRRSTRRNPNPDDDEDDDDDSGGKRREKKLKLVLRLPPNGIGERNRTELEESGSESDGEGKSRIKKIDAVGGEDGSGMEKAERHASLVKATKGEMTDSEPLTPLPDKKLLVFILDRLQKKDTYGVFSEPVDPNELPDYLDIIEHPMDFSTIREKLSSGAYANLEQFEEDVFLISLNAMRYNSPDTIYFRQARSIHELAKKDFENLRQESDDNEPEPKVVRRGRPPSKNIIKKMLNRPASDLASSNTSARAINNANASDKALWSNSSNDMLRKGSASDKLVVDSSARVSQASRNGENYGWLTEKKSERNDEFSGSMLKGLSTRYSKKPIVSEENRRNTYKQPLVTVIGAEPSVLTTFDGERKELVPIGLHMEHAYARSLARFAANLGPVGWEIAARQIERVLPPGTKFGRGWVGEKDSPQQHQPSLPSSSFSQQPVISPAVSISKADQPPQRVEPSSNRIVAGETQPNRLSPSSAPMTSNRADPADIAENSRSSTYESNINLPSGGSTRPKAPFQLHESLPVQPSVNGFNTGFAYSLSQVSQMARPTRPTGSLAPEMLMSHAHALDMVSRSNNNLIRPAVTSHFEAERTKMANPGLVNTDSNYFHPAASNSLSTERVKTGNVSAVNFGNNFIHPSTVSHFEGGKTKSNNMNAANLSNRLIHPVAAVQSDAERPKLGSPNTVNSASSFIHPEPTCQLECQRTVIGNPSTVNPGNKFQPAGVGRAEVDTTKSGNPRAITSSSPLPESSQNSQRFWKELSLHPKQASTPPDLNVRFQSPGSPASTAVIDSQQPDLALQL